MQRKMGVSEPYHKTESGNQTASNKRITRLSTTTPKVQIPDGFGNIAECKCVLEALLAGVYTKHAAEQHMHLNRSKTRKIHCNTLRNFPLQSFSKHLPWFRCSRKRKHLNRAERQNPAANSLTTNALQYFQQLRQRSDTATTTKKQTRHYHKQEEATQTYNKRNRNKLRQNQSKAELILSEYPVSVRTHKYFSNFELSENFLYL